MTPQEVLDKINEHVLAAYDAGDLSLEVRMAIDDILELVSDELNVEGE